jgi:hypothetical protein
MSQDNYFTRVPDALYDALRDGEITPLMFDIMTHLHRWANWNTGIVQTCNAKRLRTALGGQHDDRVPEERTIQRAVQGLDEAGWIISGYVRGMKVPYGVQITNFLPAPDVDGEKALIIPMETKHWKETSAFQGADEGAEKALMQTVKRRLKELDCSQDCSNKTVHQTSVTTDQPTYPSINPTSADADAQGLGDVQNPLSTESVPNQNQNPTSFLEIGLATFFPRAQVTAGNLRLMEEINARLCTEEVTHNGRTSSVSLEDLLNYNWAHFADGSRKSGLKLRSLRQAHKAIVNGDPENGVMAQFATHDKDTCKTCMKNAVAEQKREAAIAKFDPMVKEMPLIGYRGEFTTQIVRKPRTKRERQELLSWRHNPKKRWEKVAPFLAQDNCPECHGSGRPCQCIVMEEVI